MNDNEALVRRFFQEAFNEGRLEAVDELLSPAFEEHQSMAPGAPSGRDAPKAIITALRRGFSDFQMTIEDCACQGDTVWARLVATGTQDGPFMGKEPSGKRIRIDVIDVMRLEGGRIVEHWGVADALAALRQIS